MMQCRLLQTAKLPSINTIYTLTACGAMYAEELIGMYQCVSMSGIVCCVLQEVGSTRQLVPVVISKEQIGSAAGQTGRCIIGCSASGEYISACWPATRTFAVFYRTLAGTWQEVDVGVGVDLVWHSHR